MGKGRAGLAGQSGAFLGSATGLVHAFGVPQTHATRVGCAQARVWFSAVRPRHAPRVRGRGTRKTRANKLAHATREKARHGRGPGRRRWWDRVC